MRIKQKLKKVQNSIHLLKSFSRKMKTPWNLKRVSCNSVTLRVINMLLSS